MIWRVFFVAVAVAFPATTGAQTPDVGFLGVASADLPAADTAPIESQLGASLSKGWRVRGKDELIATVLTDGEVAARLASARAAAAAGDAALRAFDLAKARVELDRALSHYDSFSAERIVPGELAKVLEQRATLAFALRHPDEMRAELRRLRRVHPTKELDSKVFPPEAIAAFESESGAPPAESASEPLAELARRARVPWVVAANAHVENGALVLTLTAASARGEVHGEVVRVPTKDALADLASRGASNLLAAAGVARTVPVAIAEPRPTPSARAAGSPPKERDRRVAAAGPLHTRWWFWAAIVATGAAAGFAASNAAAGDGRPGGGGDGNVTVVFDPRE